MTTRSQTTHDKFNPVNQTRPVEPIFPREIWSVRQAKGSTVQGQCCVLIWSGNQAEGLCFPRPDCQTKFPVGRLASLDESKTRNQLRVAIECQKGVKVKVVKWC